MGGGGFEGGEGGEGEGEGGGDGYDGRGASHGGGGSGSVVVRGVQREQWGRDFFEGIG